MKTLRDRKRLQKKKDKMKLTKTVRVKYMAR